MVPVPSYPLFDHLTALDGVRPSRIRSTITVAGRSRKTDLDDRWTPAVRAVLAVSPNNPTGSVLSAAELETLAAICADRHAALIIDEVFAEYVRLGRPGA